MEKTDIDSLEIQNPWDLKEQIAEFFIFWQKKEGNHATIERLKWALKDAQLLEALEKMEKFNRDKPVTLQEDTDSVIINTTPSPPPVRNEARDKDDTASDTSANEARTFECTKIDTDSHDGSVCLSLSMSSTSDGHSQPRDTASSATLESLSLLDISENEIDVAFSFPSDTSAQSIMSLCKREHTLCVITSSSSISECKVSGRLDSCCRTLQGVLKREMKRLKQCQRKTISISDQNEWNQTVGAKGCVNKAIRYLSGATVWISESESFPKSCNIEGFPKQVQVAEELIERAKLGQRKGLEHEATAENVLARIKRDLEEFCHFVFID